MKRLFAGFLLAVTLFLSGEFAGAASERRSEALAGGGAAVGYFGVGAVDTFRPGAELFTDRNYKVKECPAWLLGKSFLRGSIEWGRLIIASDGVLTVLTPAPDHPRAASQVKTLETRGFVRIANPEQFQLFGAQPFDVVRIYQKQVKKGERIALGKWGVVVGFSSAEPVVAADKPWSANTGERLYNGIVLPEEWPPQTVDPRDTAPMAVPYLDCPPKVIPIDVGRQLFVDDFLIATNTLTRVFHMPKKYAGNPILKPETPLELHGDKNSAAVPKSGGVWWDPAEKTFKMWYEAGWIGTICYATSKDGLTWERPSLDVKPGTNQVLPPDLTPDSWTVVPDWDAKDPMQRYKLFMRPPGGQMPGISMTSPDGIHWTNRVTTGETGDRSTMFYNPFRNKWVYSLRSGFRGRSRHYWECDDFLAGAKWKPDEPVAWAAVDRDDPQDPVIGRVPQLYNLDAVAYESLLLGFFEIHHGPENDVCEKTGIPKITELNFAYSRDGFHWSRPDRRAHIPAERRDVWDRGYVQSLGNLCCVRGDTLWFYYSAFRGDTSKTNVAWLKNGMYDRGATGVAFLRRDGFASMEAGPAGGALTTRPIAFNGSRVFVNAAVAGGELRAEILDEAGQPIVPFTSANCRGVSADSTLTEVSWAGADDVSALRGRPVRFRFTLRGGALYAFWVSRDATGRSDGYVAGGGPGFTGKTDTVGRGELEAETSSLGAAQVRSLLPPGWEPKQASDKVLEGLFNVCAPQVKGAHDASCVIVDGKAYIVYIANDKQPGENPAWDFLYVALSVVDVKSGKVDAVIPVASAERAYENAKLPLGAAFVPRIIKKDGRTLRCFFNSENPGAYEAQTWAIDYDIGRGSFDNRIYKARLKTSQGVFDMQPKPFYLDAVAHGFTGKPHDYGLYAFDIKRLGGQTYVALNNYPVGQNALAVLGDDLLTFEVLGHYNEPASMKLTESAVNRLPDGTWLAVCRQEGGTRNYVFTQSADGKRWTPGEYRNVIRNGTSSKPTFDLIGGVYWLGWQEAAGTHAVARSIFNVEVSRDGANWERKYRFVTDKSFQYPTFCEYDGHVYVCVTQGDSDPSRKERIMFGRVE